ncbi:FkbM family methyltransferase [Crocosphaera sp. Alani8]|uniref:FkbM family methyltransferase n=1 Tax=Crocosphaera sp. Alani8 TaxID=3038952 RepID=UPI00313B93D9
MVEIDNLPYTISIVLFTRYPDPGKVKTRLAWDIGDRLAAEINRIFMSKMLAILLRKMKGVNIIINYTGIDDTKAIIEGFDSALAEDIDQGIKSGILYFIKQPSISFGERIDAIAKKLGKVIIIGSDIPGITSDILSEAIEYINQEQAAIALTADNGYYLIALPYYRDVFTSINYGLENVAQQTYNLMQQNYSCVSILNPTLVDVDEISDLKSLGLMDLIEQKRVDISVIIPTLNEVDFIYETLATVIKQAATSSNIEILVIDGGSNDGTLQRVEKLKKDHPPILMQLLKVSSLGRAFQMNLGLRHSSGKYLIFCHADTLLPSEWDRKAISELEDENTKLAYFDLQFYPDHLGLKLVAWTVNHIRRSPYGDQVFCVRRDDFKEIEGFDYLCLLEDVTLFNDRINYKQCHRIPDHIITNGRKYSNQKGNHTYLSIFKNVIKNWGIMAGKKLLNLPANQLKKLFHDFSPEDELLEVPFQNKIYTFKYHFPEKLLHKLLIWKIIYYQKSMNQLIPEILKHCQGNDFFIDIGAKVGVVSCLLSMVLAKNRIKTDIIAFETVPFRHKLFQDNLSFYVGEMRNKIYIENVTLGNTESLDYFKVEGTSLDSIENKENKNTIEVKIIPLDEYELPNEKKISVIKIDFEVEQLEVLKGMKNTIKKHRPILIFQDSPPLMSNFLSKKNNIKDIVEFIKSLNYKVDNFNNINYVASPIIHKWSR